MTITWEAPPSRWHEHPTNKGKILKHADVADELRGKPGEWAVVRQFGREGKNAASTFAWHVGNGKLKAFPAGEFEAVSRLSDGRYKVFVRWIGKAGE